MVTNACVWRCLAVAAGLAVAAPVLAQTAAAPAFGAADVAAHAPPVPDYQARASWAVFAGSGFSRDLPGGATPAARHAKVAVFFVHPTTFRGAPDQFNQDVGDAAAYAWVDDSSIARQASVFSACCTVYAPRYRAASYSVFANPALQAAAFDLAYSDVERAFDVFLTAIGDRPFILAGHSQGAFHVATLLERRIDGTALQKRLVAAYTIGINLSEGDFGKRFHALKPCLAPAQTGCVVQWNSYLPDTDQAKMRGFAQSTYVKRYGDDPGKTILCINPLTFDASHPAAPAAAATGAIPGAPGSGPLRALQKGAVAAQCSGGLLLVTPEKSLDLGPLPGGVMHYHDYGLFWADIRANAVLRATAFGKRHTARGAKRNPTGE